MLEIPIIFEDDDIIVVNKPANCVVNAAESVREETVQSWMKEYLEKYPSPNLGYSALPDDFTEEYGSADEIFLQRTGIAHRLDRDTSGVLILGKNPGAMINLMAQFKRRETEKEYLCLVHGYLPAKKDIIKMPIMRSTTQRHKFQVMVGGKPAETHYQVEKTYQLPQETLQQFLKFPELRQGKTDAQLMKDYQSYGEFSLIRCQPKTGRTHQIRVHFAFLQHPLVGDEVYTNKWRSKTDKIWCSRQFLHAASLTFVHPQTHKRMTIEAPLPDDLQQSLQFLEEIHT